MAFGRKNVSSRVSRLMGQTPFNSAPLPYTKPTMPPGTSLIPFPTAQPPAAIWFFHWAKWRFYFSKAPLAWAGSRSPWPAAPAAGLNLPRFPAGFPKARKGGRRHGMTLLKHRAVPTTRREEPPDPRKIPPDLRANPPGHRAELLKHRTDPTNRREDPPNHWANPTNLRANPTNLRADPTNLRADPTDHWADPPNH